MEHITVTVFELLVLLLLIGSFTLLLVDNKQKKLSEKLHVMNQSLETRRILENLVPITDKLVYSAEVLYNNPQMRSGAGLMKRAYVIDELYSRIPDEYKKNITIDNLDTLIDCALNRNLFEYTPPKRYENVERQSSENPTL